MGKNFNNFENQVLASIRTRNRAAWFGPPGVGKTAALLHVLKKHRISSDVVLISLRDYQDIIGWPLPDKKKTTINGVDLTIVRYAPPRFAVEAATAAEKGRPHAIVFDEISCATPTQQSYFLRVFNESVVGELELDPRYVAMLALYNPPDMAAGGFTLTLPMATRLNHFEFGPDRDGWISNFPTYWGEPPNIQFGDYTLDESLWGRARALVAAFIRASGDLNKFHCVPEDQSQWDKPSPNARTWDHASQQLAYVLQDGCKVEEALPLVCACVGFVGQECITWMKQKDLRDPEEILYEEIDSFDGTAKESAWKTDKDSPFKCPARGDVAYGVLSALSAAVSHNITPARSKAMWRILRAAAEQNHKDTASSACVPFFAKFRERSTKLPLVVDEAMPYLKFVQMMGKLTDLKAS